MKTKGAARSAADPYPIQASRSEARSAGQGTQSSWCLITTAADVLPVLETLNAIALSDITGTNGEVDGFSVGDIALPDPPAVNINWDG